MRSIIWNGTAWGALKCAEFRQWCYSSLLFPRRPRLWRKPATHLSPASGTQIRWSDGGNVEAVNDLGAGMCRFKDRRNGKIFDKMIGAILPAVALLQPHMNELRSLVPLAVGKSVSWQHTGADDKGANVTWTITVAVEKYETVETPAGTWPCFVILQREQILSGTGRFERRWWYSPDVGYAVKFEYVTAQGHPPVRTPANTYVVEISKKIGGASRNSCWSSALPEN
jgi:hypothetical protein